MLKFIWNFWWRNKERFLLVIIGALIVSVGLSYLVGITQANRATVVNELQKRWKSSYHIVVRPNQTRSVTEERRLLEPNYLSGIDGGISLEQYEQIKSITGVDIAAPIAMMGFMQNSIQLAEANKLDPGVYRMNIKESTETGIDTEINDYGNIYFPIGDWDGPGDPSAYGVTWFNGQLEYGSNVLLAGIDPEAEAALVGLDQAVIMNKNSRFLTSEDKMETIDDSESTSISKIPVLLSNQEFVEGNITYTIDKLDISLEDDPVSVMEMIKEKGGSSYLDKQAASPVEQHKFTTKETHQKIVEQISGGAASSAIEQWLMFQPSPVNYREVTSPFPERWPYTYEVEPYTIPKDSPLAIDHAYREISMVGGESRNWPRLQLDFKGIFDPRKLNISKDPLTELPMETYFPSKAKWVLDKETNPVNPPQEMKPLNNPYGFLTKPPMILTTIEAAANVIGEHPISAIRVKVKGVDTLTEESEQVLQAVANEIEEKTGLMTDITLGSSPQPALTHIPGIDGNENIGWVEQPWIKLGSSMTIFQESKIGMAGVVGSVIAVAIVYVFTSNIIMMYARKKEFAVLLALGWRPNQLMKLLFIEAILAGLFVSVISWVILGLIYTTNDIQTSGWRIILIGIFGISIYVLGTVIPGFLVRNISPYETMRTGEISHPKKRYFRTKSIYSMAVNNLLVKWKRSLLSVIAIALPTSLLIVFLFITFQLKGTMYTTWLGEFVAMEVGPMHYVAMGVAMAIAILTTAEIIWQNVSERQVELAVLKASGWRNQTIRNLVLIEGSLCGLFAGVVGLFIAFCIIFGMYGQFPLDQLAFLLGTILIPIVTGVIGALLPAEKAVKTQPNQGLGSGVTNDPKAEKRFKFMFGAAGIILFLGIILLLMQAIPDVQESKFTHKNDSQSVEGTSGEVEETIALGDQQKESEDEADDNEAEEKNIIEKRIEKAWRVLDIGDELEDYDKTFIYKRLQDNPKDIELKRENTEFITIAAELIDIEEESPGSYLYKPHTGGIYLLDDQGNKYISVDYDIITTENWNKIYFTSPGRAKTILTFEVPKDVKQLIMIEKDDVAAGEIVVKIK